MSDRIKRALEKMLPEEDVGPTDEEILEQFN